MVRNLLLTGALLAAVTSMPAFAQSNQTIIREAIPSQQNFVLANSPQDLALQEEIRRIKVYNAQINSQVGIFDDGSHTVYHAAPTTPIVNKYAGRKIELFAPSTATAPATQVSYASSTGQIVNVIPSTTIITRRPVSGVTSIHRVIKGDTLYSLARTNCISVADIRGQNALADNNISLGQVLTLPAEQCNTIAASANVIRNDGTAYVRRVEPLPTSINTGVSNNYAVLPKDTLYSIGKRYCLKAQDLASFNGISTRESIQPGQILALPRTACK